MGFEPTGDMKTMEFCGATRPSEKLPSQRVERVTCFATDAEISSRKNQRASRIQISDSPRKKHYDKSPNDRTVSTASYRSPAFTCRRMRCIWFLTVCSERCKALAISLLVHPLATNETSSCCLRVIVSGLYLTMEFKLFRTTMAVFTGLKALAQRV